MNRAAGGGVLGYGMARAISWGFKRGAFSNEAGLGASVLVHCAANVEEPVQQGMWGMFEVFADTMVVCTLTALVVLTSGLVDLDTGHGSLSIHGVIAEMIGLGEGVQAGIIDGVGEDMLVDVGADLLDLVAGTVVGTVVLHPLDVVVTVIRLDVVVLQLHLGGGAVLQDHLSDPVAQLLVGVLHVQVLVGGLVSQSITQNVCLGSQVQSVVLVQNGVNILSLVQIIDVVVLAGVGVFVAVDADIAVVVVVVGAVIHYLQSVYKDVIG
ncbi:MAG: hypothetical protein EGQ85_00105 [Faecalibacterium prausnitzii]|nr:hypothetical protein [Faecalibacterium prausnitzii]